VGLESGDMPTRQTLRRRRLWRAQQDDGLFRELAVRDDPDGMVAVAASGRNRGHDSVGVFWPRPALNDDPLGIVPGSYVTAKPTYPAKPCRSYVAGGHTDESRPPPSCCALWRDRSA